MFDQLIERLKALRISATNQVVDQNNVMDTLEGLNNAFVELRDAWLTFSDEERQQQKEKFLAAQLNFHFVGNYVLYKSKRTPSPVVMPPEPPASAADEQFALQLRFGDTDVATTSSADNTMFNNTVPNLVASTSGLQQPMVVRNKGDEMDCDSAPLNNTIQPVTDNVLNASEGSAEPIDEQWPEQRLTELASLSFEQCAALFQPVFSLQPVVTLTPDKIEQILTAVQSVAAQVNESQLNVDQNVVRILIMHVITTLDATTKKCWKHRVKNQEPTFQFLINFLIDCKDDTVDSADNGASVQSASKPFKIPNITHTVSAGNVVQPKRGGAARANSPSPARNPNKRPKATGDIRCRLCQGVHGLHKCPVFLGKSMEDREACLARMQLCINCFSSTHSVRMCLDGKCKLCNQKHNSLIHHRSGRPAQ